MSRSLISAPRRSSASPSPDGTLALYTQSTYSFATHSRTSGIYILDISSGKSTALTTDGRAKEPRWLGFGQEVVWLKEGDNGITSLIVADAKEVGKTYTAGTVPAPVSNLKIHLLDGLRAVIAFSTKSTPDGSLYNPKNTVVPHSSAKIYDSLFVRHWDTYIEAQRNTICTGLLQKKPSNVTARDGRWNLLGVTNMLRGTPFECPMPPFGGTDHFDLSDSLLVFVSKWPSLDPATHTACLMFGIELPDYQAIHTWTAKPKPITAEGSALPGAKSCPTFSSDGKWLANLQMSEDGYESDQNKIALYRTEAYSTAQALRLEIRYGQDQWDLSPSSIKFSADGSKIFALAEDKGCTCLFEVDLKSSYATPAAETLVLTARKLTSSGSISDFTYASYLSSKLFISASSLTESSIYYVLDPALCSTVQSHPTPSPRTLVSSLTTHGSTFGISSTQVSSLWFPGANSHPIHAFLVIPSFLKPGTKKKYPLAYLIHGGPQGAWLDSWSTRWNPLLFAEQGYVVICPNPTGSTGYGQAFTDAIQGSWGGLPYEDLEAGIDHISSNPYLSSIIDTTRMVALGASYGGYMVNWIQSKPLGRRFKALVTHDGVFSMAGAMLGTEELYFPLREFRGPMWNSQRDWDKWDPSRHVDPQPSVDAKTQEPTNPNPPRNSISPSPPSSSSSSQLNWTTPHLIIHNSLDYRLPISEGLAAFNTLQMRSTPSRFLTFPDENHWVLGHENSLVWHSVVFEWIGRFVGLGDTAGTDGTQGIVERYQVDRSGLENEAEPSASASTTQLEDTYPHPHPYPCLNLSSPSSNDLPLPLPLHPSPHPSSLSRQSELTNGHGHVLDLDLDLDTLSVESRALTLDETQGEFAEFHGY